MKESSKKYSFALVTTVIIAVVFLLVYLKKTVYDIPLMDYWLGLSDYIATVFSKGFDISTVLTIPHRIHWNPFFSLCQYFFVKYLKCSNEAYIYSGVFFIVLSILLVLKHYRESYERTGVVEFFIGAVLFVMPIINLNQWEILTLFCNFAFMFRIFFFLLFFYLFDKSLHSQNDSWIKNIGLGLMITLVMVFAGQAYIFGVFVGTCAVILFDCISIKKVQRKHVINLVIQTIGVLFYYLTLEKDSLGFAESTGVSLFGKIGIYIRGVLIMISAPIIHIDLSNQNMSYNYVVGILVLIAVIFAIIVYIKKQWYKRTYFPIFCLIYAFVSILVIIHGRAFKYGLESVVASRYVVETTLGYLGLLEILWIFILEKGSIRLFRYLVILFFAAFIIAFGLSNSAEMVRGPYRKLYGDTMKERAIHIESTSDEDLAIFQAPAGQVRSGVAAMKKNHLCIWRNKDYVDIFFSKAKYNADKYVLSGISYPEEAYSWTDGTTVELECSLIGHTDKVHTMIDLVNVYNGKQNVTIEVNSKVVYEGSVTGGETIEFDFPNDRDKITMIIHLPDAADPSSGTTPDVRRLGLAISRITVLVDE